MPRANLPVPESISGERSLGTPFTDLAVKARPTSGEYAAPTIQRQPDLPKANAFSQLADALSDINPALRSVAAKYQQEQVATDSAEAKKRYSEVRVEYAEAVEKGLIPAGASRAYVEAYKATELDTKRQRHNVQLHQAYDESGLKDIDDPAAMEQFVTKFNQSFRESALMREGADRYTARELAYAKFDEGLQGNINSLTSQHIQYRTNERTKQGKETALTNAGLKIENYFSPENSTTTGPAAAQEIMNSFFNPLTGVGANGMTKTEANKSMVDLIASKMVEHGDERFADLASHITTHGNNKLAGTQYAREKFKEASNAVITEKIRNSNWNWQSRERSALEASGLGPEEQARMKAEEKARQHGLWEHQDKMNAHAERVAAKGDVDAELLVRTNSHVSNILTAINGRDMSNPRVHTSLEWLKVNAGDKAMTMINWINAQKKEGAAFSDTPASELASARLRYEMSSNPLKFDPSSVIAAANNGVINPKAVQTLMDDWDKARTHMDSPYLLNPGFGKLVTDLRKVAVKDADDQYGPGAINAMRVEQQLRQNAYDWIEQNPKGSYLEFIKEMRAQAEPLAQDFSPEFAKDEAKKLSKKQSPQLVPQKDTRDWYEKAMPTAIGGLDKPKPTAQPAQGPAPMKVTEAFGAMKSESQTAFKKLMQDPNADDMDIEAVIYNSGLYSFMKSNGRTAAEFKALKDELLGARKNFK